MADAPVEPPRRDRAERIEQARDRVEQARERTRERVDVARERVEEARGRFEERAEQARMTTRRLFGIDRSGPPPPQTLAGHPLHPWTIPNAIGFVRLALIPVFLAVALSSSEGRDALAATIFAVIGWSDYLDGFAARVTGQYSRLGALMDPVIDRLLVIAGVVVCWHFALLPRWALAVLVAREASMLVLGRYGLRHGVDIRINWPGRLAVAPVMGALFFPMTGLETLGEILLYIGLALALTATALYLRSGRAQVAARSAPSSSD